MPPRIHKLPQQVKQNEPKRARKSAQQMLCDAWPDFVRWMQQYWDRESLVLPMPPNMANARVSSKAHPWAGKNKIKKAYAGQLQSLQTLRLLPTPPVKPPARAIMTATMVLSSPMDDDNALARVKWAQDFLVANGYLQGDSRRHLRWGELPTQIVTRSEPQRIIFEIREDI